MRDRGLAIAWTALCLLLAASGLYAETSYRFGRGGGEPAGAALDVAPADAPPGTGVGISGQPVEGQPAPPAPPPVQDIARQPAAERQPSEPPPPRVAFAAAHPPEDGRARIVIIVSEIGLSRARSRDAIDRLPEAVTMAVMAYADDRASWVDDIRAAGHEALLAVPMEPEDYPRIDPGPGPLLTNMDDLENLARYDKALSNASGVVGVLAHMGGRFLAESARMRPILAATVDRGLLFVDSRASPDSAVEALSRGRELHVLLNDRFIDVEPSQQAIAQRLDELEAIAARQGHAVGIALPYPVSIELIRAWAADLETRGAVLAPASAVARALPE